MVREVSSQWLQATLGSNLVVLETAEAQDEYLAATIQKRLGNRIRDLRVLRSQCGVILQGRVPTYYAKQLAQQAILELGERIAANEIEVQ